MKERVKNKVNFISHTLVISVELRIKVLLYIQKSDILNFRGFQGDGGARRVGTTVWSRGANPGQRSLPGCWVVLQCPPGR